MCHFHHLLFSKGEILISFSIFIYLVLQLTHHLHDWKQKVLKSVARKKLLCQETLTDISMHKPKSQDSSSHWKRAPSSFATQPTVVATPSWSAQHSASQEQITLHCWLTMQAGQTTLDAYPRCEKDLPALTITWKVLHFLYQSIWLPEQFDCSLLNNKRGEERQKQRQRQKKMDTIIIRSWTWGSVGPFQLRIFCNSMITE